MNFYRVGKTVGVTQNVELFLNESQHTHKAVLFPNSSVGGGTFKVTLHDGTTSTPQGITLAVVAGTAASPYIFPGVIRSITPSVTQRIVLLG
jgi:hypothetical protein